MFKKICKVIKNPKLIILRVLNLRIFRILSDKTYLKIKYRLKMGKKLDLKKPKTYNEKIQWLKLHDTNPFYTNLVDKVLVREYIKEKIGEEYLIPLIGTYNNFDEIDFSKLPNQFVLKPNHTSGNVFICKNKDEIDYKKLKRIVAKWMKREYYWYHREWPYKNIEPKLLIEQYLINDSDKELKDYKFMCSNGNPFCLFVAANRHKKAGLTLDFYDLDFNHMPFKRHYKNSPVENKKPKNFDQMISLAKVLSEGLKFIRVDFYEANEKIYFGELTFYPASGFGGFTPEEYDLEIGKSVELF